MRDTSDPATSVRATSDRAVRRNRAGTKRDEEGIMAGRGVRLIELGRNTAPRRPRTRFGERTWRSRARTLPRRLPGQAVLERDRAFDSLHRSEDRRQAYSGWNIPPPRRICSAKARNQWPGRLDRAASASTRYTRTTLWLRDCLAVHGLQPRRLRRCSGQRPARARRRALPGRARSPSRTPQLQEPVG